MNRSFVRSSLDADHRSAAYKITCRQCGKTDRIGIGSHSGSLPPEVSAKKFKQRGWAVGNREGDDLCNICVAANKVGRKQVDNVVQIPALKLKDLSRLKELQDLAAAAAAAATPAPAPTTTETAVEKNYTVAEAYKAGWAGSDKLYNLIATKRLTCFKNAEGSFVIPHSELVRVLGSPKGVRQYTARKNKPDAPAPTVVEPKPLLNDGVKPMNFDPKLPPEMTKEDRRIIFAEIDSHYLDETRGYENSYDDKRVAEGLKVPMAWVRTIREDNFGPERGDAITAEIDKLKEMHDEAEVVMGKMRKLWNEMDATINAFTTRQNEVSAEAAKIYTAMAEAKTKIDTLTRK